MVPKYTPNIVKHIINFRYQIPGVIELKKNNIIASSSVHLLRDMIVKLICHNTPT